jgi:hypothetical protein
LPPLRAAKAAQQDQRKTQQHSKTADQIQVNRGPEWKPHGPYMQTVESGLQIRKDVEAERTMEGTTAFSSAGRRQGR